MRRLILPVLAMIFLAGRLPAYANDGFVEANGLKVHYVDKGDGPALLLTHGGSLTLNSWQALISQASGKYHVYAYDSRGHGATNNPTGKFSYDLLAQDAVAIIGALHLDHPFVVGYSDGGMTALELAAKHGDLVRAVVVGGATYKIAASPHYFEGMRSAFGVAKTGPLTERDLDEMAAAHPDTMKFYTQIHHRDDNPNYWRVLLKQAWPMWMTKFTIPEKQLRGIKVPMLVVLADHDDFSDLRDAVSIQEDVANGELAILPGAKHSVFREQSDVFDKIVLDFLNAH